MSQVVDDNYEPLEAMGFDVLQAFEEITNSPEVYVFCIDPITDYRLLTTCSCQA